jgi:small subunit ribosomal protein S6
MQTYDLNLILNPSLSSEQVVVEKEYVTNAIKNAGGEVVGMEELGNRRMAYPILKDREGYYLFYRVQMGGNPEKDIGGSLRLRDHIRRVLIVRDRPEWKTKKA